jgi:hypothetical protein
VSKMEAIVCALGGSLLLATATSLPWAIRAIFRRSSVGPGTWQKPPRHVYYDAAVLMVWWAVSVGLSIGLYLMAILQNVGVAVGTIALSWALLGGFARRGSTDHRDHRTEPVIRVLRHNNRNTENQEKGK